MVETDLFKQFVAAVTAKQFFQDAGGPGDEMYEERFKKVVVKFRNKLSAKAAAAAPAGAAADALTASSADTGGASSSSTEEESAIVAASAADEKEAERMKVKGNEAMARKDYKGAEAAYCKALDLSPRGPSSHIFFSNRAAALCYLSRYAEVESDCERAIALSPNYGKAHARLGLARYYLEDYEGAEEAYLEAMKLDPDNAINKDYMQKVKAKLGKKNKKAGKSNGAGGKQGNLNQQAINDPMAALGAMGGGGGGAGAGANGGGMPDMAAMQQAMASMGMGGAGGGRGGGGGAGGGNPLAAMMNNPQMMQMAQQMMSNPQMQAMASNLMSNPDAINNMMSSLGENGAGGGGM
jgi:small glutamine-rich tetratricopeptide repeat-containing protein alpha